MHCSAGVGRTGTFIGLCNCYGELAERGCVSVFETVRRLKEQRMQMVESEEQYMFIYSFIAEDISKCLTIKM